MDSKTKEIVDFLTANSEPEEKHYVLSGYSTGVYVDLYKKVEGCFIVVSVNEEIKFILNGSESSIKFYAGAILGYLRNLNPPPNLKIYSKRELLLNWCKDDVLVRPSTLSNIEKFLNIGDYYLSLLKR